MNPGFQHLHPYPFEKLAKLRADVSPSPRHSSLDLTIGEPKHPTPALVREALVAHLETTERYPTTAGLPALRECIASWLSRRFALAPGSLDASRHVLPVNGTREALFAFAQLVVDAGQGKPCVVMPNPFYQIYEGAALLAGAQPLYLDAGAAQGYEIDFDAVPASTWASCQLLYICSPANPSGRVHDAATLRRLLDLAEAHDFIIAADECYSEIYPDEAAPPVGLLEVAAERGFRRAMVFHSLSKRSNAPGLRSGFVAGDPALISAFLRYRTYHGCSMPLYTQYASIAAWGDEEHVRANRQAYRRKFDAVLEILDPVLDVQRPDGSFYLWPRLPMDDTVFARDLLARYNVAVLPGSFLGRDAGNGNPGADHVRMALVAPLAECIEAAQRIREFLAAGA